MPGARRVLLLGYPLEHTLSPRFQKAAFLHLGLDIDYLSWPLCQCNPFKVRKLLSAPGTIGANVTVPHKRAIIDSLDQLSPSALKVGAVNTIIRQGSCEHGYHFSGHNTDLEGLAADLELRFADAHSVGTIIILGAGGAAGAAAFAASKLSGSLVIVNRTLDHANQLLSHLRDQLAPEKLNLEALPWPKSATPHKTRDALHQAFSSADLVIDATSMAHGSSFKSPQFLKAVNQLSLLPLKHTPPGTLFYDLKYPAPTPLLQLARELNRPGVDGRYMLVQQGARSFELWTGLSAPLEIMLQALEM